MYVCTNNSAAASPRQQARQILAIVPVYAFPRAPYLLDKSRVRRILQLLATDGFGAYSPLLLSELSITKDALPPRLDTKNGPSTWNGSPVRTDEF